MRTRLASILKGEPSKGEDTSAPYFNQYRALTKQEMCDLVKALEGNWKLAMVCMFYLVLTVDELCKLTWKQLDLDNAVAHLSDRCSRPMHPALLSFLRGWPGIKTGKLVSFESGARMRNDAGTILRAAGVKDPRIRLTSVRKTTVLMLKRLGVVISPIGNFVNGAEGRIAAHELLPNILNNAD